MSADLAGLAARESLAAPAPPLAPPVSHPRPLALLALALCQWAACDARDRRRAVDARLVHLRDLARDSAGVPALPEDEAEQCDRALADVRLAERAEACAREAIERAP